MYEAHKECDQQVRAPDGMVRTRNGTSKVRAAEVLAAHKEWVQECGRSSATSLLQSSGVCTITAQQQQVALAKEVLAAHKEWDALLEEEASHPPHFECLKKDPYLSDYEEMRSQDVVASSRACLKSVNGSNSNQHHDPHQLLLDDDYCDFDDLDLVVTSHSQA